MKKLITLAATCATLVATPLTFNAQRAHPSIYIENKTPNAIWVTTYASPTGRSGIIKATCFTANTTGYTDGNDPAKGSWVLVEFKAAHDSCKAPGNLTTASTNAKRRLVAVARDAARYAIGE